MKKLIGILFLGLIFSISIFSQFNIGSNTNNPYAVLQLQGADSSQGLIVPYVTTSNRPTPSDTIKGMVIYNLNDSALQYCDGVQWVTLIGDNLGNHIATQNIQLEGNWLSGNGDNIGVNVTNDSIVRLFGTVNVNRTPTYSTNVGVVITARSGAESPLIVEDNTLADILTVGSSTQNVNAKNLTVGGAVPLATSVFRIRSTSNDNSAYAALFENQSYGDLFTIRNDSVIYASGRMGVGTAPSNKLHVTAASDPVKFEGLQNDASLDTVITVDGSGVLHKSALTDIVDVDTMNILQDTDRDTKIQVEETADDDIIRFDMEGTEFFRMDSGRFEVVNTGSSVFIGDGAGENDDYTNNNNTYLGYHAGQVNVSGTGNIGLGYNALGNQDQNGNYINAIGHEAARYDSTTGNAFVNAIGYRAAYSNNGTYLNAFGYSSANNNTGNHANTIGHQSGYNNTGGDVNLIGRAAGYANTGSGINAMGVGAAQNNGGSNINAFGQTSASDNTGNNSNMMGVNAGRENSGAHVNAFGTAAGYSNAGSYNNAFGNNALAYTGGGSYINAIGLQASEYDSTTGNAHVNAIGYYAGRYNKGIILNASGPSSAYNNTGNNVNAIGANTGYNNTGNDANLLGRDAGYNNTAINVNAFGQNAGYSNTGNYLNAIGFLAARSNTGAQVNAVGVNAAYNNTGNFINAIGSYSLRYSGGGSYINAIGYQALEYDSTTGNAHVNAMGYVAGRYNKGTHTNLFGNSSGYNNTGSSVNAFGQNTGYSNTGNFFNAIGYEAGYNNTQNYVNVIGRYSADAPQPEATILTGDLYLKDPEASGGATTGNVINFNNGATVFGNTSSEVGFGTINADNSLDTLIFVDANGILHKRSLANVADSILLTENGLQVVNNKVILGNNDANSGPADITSDRYLNLNGNNLYINGSLNTDSSVAAFLDNGDVVLGHNNATSQNFIPRFFWDKSQGSVYFGHTNLTSQLASLGNSSLLIGNATGGGDYAIVGGSNTRDVGNHSISLGTSSDRTSLYSFVSGHVLSNNFNYSTVNGSFSNLSTISYSTIQGTSGIVSNNLSYSHISQNYGDLNAVGYTFGSLRGYLTTNKHAHLRNVQQSFVNIHTSDTIENMTGAIINGKRIRSNGANRSFIMGNNIDNTGTDVFIYNGIYSTAPTIVTDPYTIVNSTSNRFLAGFTNGFDFATAFNGGDISNGMRLKSDNTLQLLDYGDSTHTGVLATILGTDDNGNVIETTLSDLNDADWTLDADTLYSAPDSTVVIKGGNVGVGTTTPSNKLHVFSTSDPVKFEGLQNDASLDTVVTVDGSGVLHKSAITDIVDVDTMNILQDADRDTKIQVEESTDDDIIRFDMKGTEFFRMDSGRFEVVNTGSSVFIGDGAGENDDFSNNHNTYIGYNVGASNITGVANVALGYNTLKSARSSSNYKIALGYGASEFDSTAGNVHSIAMGYYAGRNNKGNVVNFLGVNTGENNTGSQVNAFGQLAAQDNTGSHVNALGIYAAENNTGNYINAIGGYALRNSNGGNFINAIGYQASEYDSTLGNAYVNSFGYYAGRYNKGGHANLFGQSSGYNNTGNGVNALGNVSAYNNIGSQVNAFGNSSAYNNTGTDVNALGLYSAYNNTGNNVEAIGEDAAYNNTGSNFIAIGNNAGYSNTGGNTITIGTEAGQNNAGSHNIIVGNTAGRYTGDGDFKTFIGYEAGIRDSASGSAFVNLMGYRAGTDNLGTLVNAMGREAARNNTGTNVVAIGYTAARFNTQNYVNVIGKYAADATQAEATILTGDLYLKDPEASGGATTGNVINFHGGATIVGNNGDEIAFGTINVDNSLDTILVVDASNVIHKTAMTSISANELIDADGDTKIQVEESADEDIIRFDTRGVERVQIDSNGYVGVGTNSPTSNLHIHANSLTDNNPALFVNGMAGNTSNETTVYFQANLDNGNESDVILRLEDTNPAGASPTGYLIKAFGDDHTTDGNTTDLDSVFTLRTNGVAFLHNRLGIGEYNPSNRLDIAGGAVIGESYASSNVAPTNGLLVEGYLGMGTTSPATRLTIEDTIITQLTLHLKNAESGSDWNALRIDGEDNASNPSSLEFTWQGIESGTGPAVSAVYTSSTEADLVLNATDADTRYELMRLDGSTQRVGITTSTPEDVLDVGGVSSNIIFGDDTSSHRIYVGKTENSGSATDLYGAYIEFEANDESTEKGGGITIASSLQTGNGNAKTGDINILTANTTHSPGTVGNINITAGNTLSTATPGNVYIASGNSTNNPSKAGEIVLQAGNGGAGGSGGNVEISAGSAGASVGGGGTTTIKAGDRINTHVSYAAGHLYLQGGNDTTSGGTQGGLRDGNIYLQTGEGNSYGTRLFVGGRTPYSGRVGVGTITPDTTLDVEGSIRMADGNEANGYVMVSDANGIGAWTDPSTLSTDGNGIYGGSGTIPSTTVSTVTDNFTIKATNSTIHFNNTGTGYTTIGSSTSQINNAILSVHGNFSSSGPVSFGNAGIGANQIRAPSGWGLWLGSSSFVDNSSGSSIDLRGSYNHFRFQDSGNLFALGELDLITDNRVLWAIQSADAVNVNQEIGAEFSMIGSYWDGAVAQEQDLRFYHNVTSGPLAKSQLDISIAGSNLMSVLSDGNVGIGTTSPDTTLHIEGSLKMVDGNESNGYVMVSDVDGVASWTDPSSITAADDNDWVLDGDTLYSAPDSTVVIKGGNVGIGNTSPDYALDVNGGVFVGSGVLTLDRTDGGTDATITNATSGNIVFSRPVQSLNGVFGNSSYSTASTSVTLGYTTHTHLTHGSLAASGTAFVFQAGGVADNTNLLKINNNAINRLTLTAGGRLGIGTSTPDTTLHIEGSLKMVDGNEGAGKVMLSDANGVGYWSDAPVGNQNVVSVNTTYTADINDEVILCDASGAGFTLTLPTAVGNSGKVIRVKKFESSANVLVIDANGTETIDGSLTKSLTGGWEQVTLISNGSNWALF